ncbi:MAG: type IX secretion system sortase PorU [Rubricoccaceae bacterium]|nr:type IX secretion system sortase PorU [Rubricoccaceae bacterium]
MTEKSSVSTEAAWQGSAFSKLAFVSALAVALGVQGADAQAPRRAAAEVSTADISWATEAARQSPRMELIRSSSTEVVYEVTADWETNLADAVRLQSSSADGLQLAAVNGFASVSRTVELPMLAMPSVSVLAADYDETTLPPARVPGDQGAAAESLSRFDRLPAAVTVLGMERRRPVATLSAHLLVVDEDRGSVRRYKRMVISLRYSNDPLNVEKGGGNPHLGIANSVLANGQWYKIPISREGIYRIDSGYLQSLGVDVNALNPASLKIYSNGGEPVPAVNSEPRIPDLAENAVFVSGAGDGSFDEGDALFFYAEGPTGWNWSPDPVPDDGFEEGHWSHYLNPFTTMSYVFLRVDGDAGVRVTGAGFPSWSDAVRQNQIEGRVFSEEDFVNLVRNGDGSGLEWLGAEASVARPSITVLDTIPPGLMSGGNVRYRMRAAARANPRVTLTFFANGEFVADGRPNSVTYGHPTRPLAHPIVVGDTLAVPSSGQLNVTMQMEGTTNNPISWIDWVEAVYDRAPRAHNGLLRFATPGGLAGRFEYLLDGFDSEPQVWDVTDVTNIYRLGVQNDGNRYLLQVEVLDSDTPRELVAFTGSSSRIVVPEQGMALENQNLHAVAGYPDYVIVAPTDFMSAAEDLAAHRRTRDGLNTIVVNIADIYNEFSGGMVDMRAVRDYVKFLYDRAPSEAELPRYLLLFGDGHFDYRGRTPAGVENNWIPTYQTETMLAIEESYTSDDYFGFLDDIEGEWAEPDNATSTGVWLDPTCQDPDNPECEFLSERVDVGIGRFPVRSANEAASVVEKIIHYEDPSTLGTWRSRYTFVADDEFPNAQDRDLHVQNADYVAMLLDDSYPDLNLQKIYSTSYPHVITGAGRRIPEATAEIMRVLDEGTLVWNYSGHGGHYALADERLITIDDIQQLDNFDRLSIFITATCSFGRFDMTDKQSGAEELLLNPNGGAVAMFTTVRIVYTHPNPTILNLGLNLQLARDMMEREADGRPRRLGDILRLTKGTDVGAQANNRKFSLLGDPAMRVGLPYRQVEITSLNGQPLTEERAEPLAGASNLRTRRSGAPQLRANELAVLTDQVLNSAGQPDNTFNGEVDVEVFDAARSIALDPSIVSHTDGSYKVRIDRIYRGRATVRDGQFSSQFVVPRDVSYSGLAGRISAYVVSSTGIDGGGSNESFIISETAGEPLNDTRGPEIRAFINDSTFVSGGLVGPDPTLLVRLFDENGINTVGTGVGHELLVTFDDDPATAVEVGRFYEGDLDSYQSGTVRFPLPDQEPGPHKLTVTAWDVANNSSTAELSYVLSASEDLELRNVYNYPNPTPGPTRFMFEHNYTPGSMANIQVRIFTLSGRPVRTLEAEELLTGGIVQIPFDGLDEDLDRLASGIYLYRVRMSVDDPDGGTQVTERIERLAVIR